MDYAEICTRIFNKFFEPGEVTEIRAFGLDGKRRAWEGYAGGGIVSGYFDNAEAFGRAAAMLDQAGAEGVYFILNPVLPELLARSANRLKGFNKKMKLTTDLEVACLRWLLVDLDPKRPAGISSSDMELQNARNLQTEVKDWLVKRDLYQEQEIVEAMSGNGYHLLCPTPGWPVEDEYVNSLKKSLAIIQKNFGNRDVEIDQVTFNPSRLCKVYGTMARKGDHIPARPHRRAKLQEWPES